MRVHTVTGILWTAEFHMELGKEIKERFPVKSLENILIFLWKLLTKVWKNGKIMQKRVTLIDDDLLEDNRSVI